ncbi:MAG: ABC transporter permease [Lachnospiraceae bacterium]|nr:ABC transporter permease [Lachnospiraceae bacterium]
MASLIIGIFEQGLIYGIMALGIYITYKILDFPDLTVDGSFPLGAAITVVLIMKGVNPYVTLLAAAFVGALSGIVTGIIHVKFKVRDLLSSIIVMTALYSVNLRIAGKANVALFGQDTIFKNDFINRIFDGALSPYKTVIIILIITLVAKILLDAYLITRSGYLLRAVGDNETIVTSLAKDSGKVKIVGLAIANALVALAGCVMAQQQRFFDVSMGTGTMVIGLASVIIGTKIFKNMTKVKATSAVIVGSIIYKGCVAAAIYVGLSATDMKLITSTLFLVILIITMDRKKKVK